jgi:glyoxylase-like metal-dependent hydrolase (beta-lactamase superfamily II)
MRWYGDGKIKIKKLKIPPYGTNCYIVACPTTGEGIIIDTPGAAARILRESKEVHIRFIIITHTHFDHLGAFAALRKTLGVPAVVHSAEAAKLPFPADSLLDGGETINFGTLSLAVLYTPGHSPGSICLYSPGHLFSGDTLFPGGPGNTPNSRSFKQITQSITQKLFALPDNTKVYPGHGPGTTLGQEKQNYASFASRSHPKNLCGDVLWLSS